jgi:cbb3-type cytochrome oxidase subunit 1
VLFLTGALIMTYNLWRTMQGELRREPQPTLAAARLAAAAE